MNSSYVTVGHERGYDDFELRDLSKASVSFERDDNNDAEFDYDDPLGRQADLSDDGSLETFQLYTPDEERQVRRKLDRRVILLVTLLYLLSFLDRSSSYRSFSKLRMALTRLQILAMPWSQAWTETCD